MGCPAQWAAAPTITRLELGESVGATRWGTIAERDAKAEQMSGVCVGSGEQWNKAIHQTNAARHSGPAFAGDCRRYPDSEG